MVSRHAKKRAEKRTREAGHDVCRRLLIMSDSHMHAVKCIDLLDMRPQSHIV